MTTAGRQVWATSLPSFGPEALHSPPTTTTFACVPAQQAVCHAQQAQHAHLGLEVCQQAVEGLQDGVHCGAVAPSHDARKGLQQVGRAGRGCRQATNRQAQRAVITRVCVQGACLLVGDTCVCWNVQ